MESKRGTRFFFNRNICSDFICQELTGKTKIWDFVLSRANGWKDLIPWDGFVALFVCLLERWSVGKNG
jgi:hypothetical protein